jgi:hypothetical protein
MRKKKEKINQRRCEMTKMTTTKYGAKYGVEFRDFAGDETGMPFALIYSEPGVGKTLSTIKSAPTKQLYIQGEKRNVKRTLLDNVDMKWLEQNVKRMLVTDFMGLLDFLQNPENQEKIIERYKTIIVDGITYLMNNLLLSQIEEETAEAEIFDVKSRPMVNLARTDRTGYGSLAGLMKRLCDALGYIASRDVFVCLIAQLDDVVRWNVDLQAAPAFAGKEFPRDMKAYFDLIGIVIKRYDDEGRVVFPPTIRFYSTQDENYMAKWTGPNVRNPGGPLDWSKILTIRKR